MISIEMKRDTGTMFWNAMRQELRHDFRSVQMRQENQTHTKVTSALSAGELVASTPGS